MLMKKITEAVVESFNVPNDKVVVQIVESDPNNKSRGGILYSER